MELGLLKIMYTKTKRIVCKQSGILEIQKIKNHKIYRKQNYKILLYLIVQGVIIGQIQMTKIVIGLFLQLRNSNLVLLG